jgi:hypothetical protein
MIPDVTNVRDMEVRSRTDPGCECGKYAAGRWRHRMFLQVRGGLVAVL